jgi:hypothetical protein
VNTYTVELADTPGELSKQVSDLMSSGWVPQGGISTFNKGISLIFMQALILPEDRGLSPNWIHT